MERCEGGRKGLRIAAAHPVLLGLHAGMVCYFPLGSQEVQPLSSPQLPTQFRTTFFSGVPLTCLVGDSIGTSGIVCDGVQMLLGRDGGNLLRQRHCWFHQTALDDPPWGWMPSLTYTFLLLYLIPPVLRRVRPEQLLVIMIALVQHSGVWYAEMTCMLAA